MTVYASGSIIPLTIVSGDRIRTLDASYGVGEVVKRTQSYINEFVHFTCTASDPNFYSNDYYSWFENGDTVLLVNFPTPFAAGTTYYIVNRGAGYVELSGTRGGSPITPTSTANDIHFYVGADSIPFPLLRPFPVGSDTYKEVIFYAEGSQNGSYSTGSLYFFENAAALSKPSIIGTNKDFSILIYNTVSATVVNKNISANNNLFFKELEFTNYLSKIGTAKFSVVNPGDATSTELDLLLAGSGVNAQKDNLVAIIQGNSVVWSGKITRSIQNKTGIFDSPLVQTWNIDCESDLVRMKYQEILPASKGYKRKQTGSIVSDLVGRNNSTDINWNGDFLWERGVRTSEGTFVDYVINDSDMFTQFMILAKTIDFDWRTRLGYFRAPYSRSGTTYTPSYGMPYSNDVLIGKWMVVTSPGGGLISFGKITDNSTTTITCSMTNTPAASGTLIVLLDPILDFAGNLSTPSKVQTYRMNAQPWTGGNGYGFDDKTDRSQLATKIVAKGKNEKGVTITCSVAAVQPWMNSFEMFEISTYITRRTEGRILQFTPGGLPYGAGLMWIEGWGYNLNTSQYYNLFLKSGQWLMLQQYWNFNTIEEVMFGGIRATKFVTNGILNSNGDALNGGMCCVINASDIGANQGGSPLQYPHPSQRYFVQVPAYFAAPAGQNIYINGEVIDLTSAGSDNVEGTYLLFLCDASAEHRVGTDPFFEAHPSGAIVWMEEGYDEANPAVGSPVYYHGIITQTYMSDIVMTLGELHRAATLKLIEHSQYLRKATFWCVFDNWWKTGGKSMWESPYQDPPMVGDSVMCLQDDNATETELAYGQLKNLWQVIGWSFSTKDMKVQVELGDYEKNLFALMSDKTSSLLLTVN